MASKTASGATARAFHPPSERQLVGYNLNGAIGFFADELERHFSHVSMSDDAQPLTADTFNSMSMQFHLEKRPDDEVDIFGFGRRMRVPCPMGREKMLSGRILAQYMAEYDLHEKLIAHSNFLHHSRQIEAHLRRLRGFRDEDAASHAGEINDSIETMLALHAEMQRYLTKANSLYHPVRSPFHGFFEFLHRQDNEIPAPPVEEGAMTYARKLSDFRVQILKLKKKFEIVMERSAS